MELKSYQRRAIEDLRQYLECLKITKNLDAAWQKFWDNKGEKVGNSIEHGKGIPCYNDEIKAVPSICAKIPTAGGKTFLACASIKIICDEVFKNIDKRFVIFLVPSEAILTQMIKNLNNPEHPYRQRLMADFGGSLSVFDATTLNDKLSEGILSELNVAVLSFASLRVKNKDLRKFYQENGSLYSLKDRIENTLEGSDEISVINVLRSFKPVVIVDESHNAKSELSKEMLENLNASFIYELTATPKQSSNIIHITKASELKKENMVKLPVFLYNLPSSKDVILNAISIRNKLESQAKDENVDIRPIVLFQAVGGNDNQENFDKIKQKLIDLGIPPIQIAIKTANINEIKGIDLMNKSCGIRYIITINALKEGWDCPNAYVLASLANRNSKTDVEQLIGRVLRQPKAMRYKNQSLNVSYVLTSSNDFRTTAENVVAGLNEAGFSKDDFRQENFAINEENVSKAKTKHQDDLFESNDNAEFINDDEISKDMSDDVLNSVKDKEQEYIDNINKDELMGGFKIKYEVEALPVFVRKSDGLLYDEYERFEPEMLDKEFKLSDKDRQIDFNAADIELLKVDIDESDEMPKYQKANLSQKQYFIENLKASPDDEKAKKCADKIYNVLNAKNAFNSIDSRDLKRYIELVVEDLSAEQIAELPDKLENYTYLIENKIKALRTDFRQKKFYEQIDTHQIEVKAEFSLQKAINPKDSNAARPKSLYEEESSKLNDLEARLLDAIIACENVKWWHRNADKSSEYFHINGFINHYPDFLVATNSGKIIAVEAKGDDRDNTDSKAKLKLGKKWADKAGGDYEYYMVFDKNKIDDAYNLNEFINILSKL